MSKEIQLPPPRIWKPQDLADFLRVSVSWVYKKTGPKAPDPIPRIKGMGVIRCDTHSPAFREWIQRYIDNGTGHA